MIRARNKKALRRSLWRWHRRVGLVVSLLALLLALTGIALNHVDSLRLADKPVTQRWLLALYGIEPPTLVSYPVGNHRWLSHLGGGQLYLNDRAVVACAPPLYSAVLYDAQLVAICGDDIVLLTLEGELIERTGMAYDNLRPVTALAVDRGQLLANTAKGVFSIDPVSLSFTAVPTVHTVKWQQAYAAPAALATSLKGQFDDAALNWERVVLDLHSGRILTRLGVWTMDLAAIGLVFLGLSGVWLWWRR